jgi:hypothetical protein
MRKATLRVAFFVISLQLYIMKHLKSFILLLILVGLPLVSWYFLKSGLDWRKGKVSDLKTKGLFLNSFDFSVDDKNSLYEIMAHRTSLVKLKDTLDSDDQLVIDQFKNAYTFQFISFEKDENRAKGWNSKSVIRYFEPSSKNCIPSEMRSSQYMIIDTAGLIRQYYVDDSKKTIGRMVEDLAVLLPRKKAKDIILKDRK